MCRAFGEVSDVDDSALERYRRGLVQLSEDWYDRSRHGLRLRKSVSMVMLDMLRLSAATEVSAQRDVIKYIRSSVATDGLISRCAPQVDVGQHLGRACRRHMANLLRPAAATGRSLGGWLAVSAASIDRVIRGGSKAARFLDRVSRGRPPTLEVQLASPSSLVGQLSRSSEHSRPSSTEHDSKPGLPGSVPLARPAQFALVLAALALLVPSSSNLLPTDWASIYETSPFMLLAIVSLTLLRRRPFWLPRRSR